jgi:hypothetical protein
MAVAIGFDDRHQFCAGHGFDPFDIVFDRPQIDFKPG